MGETGVWESGARGWGRSGESKKGNRVKEESESGVGEKG